MRVFFIVGCLFASTSVGSAEKKEENSPQLLVVSALQAQVKPCNCTPSLTLGGLSRLATVVRSLSQTRPTAVLLLGPSFVNVDSELNPNDRFQTLLKAGLVATTVGRFGAKTGAHVVSSAERIQAEKTELPIVSLMNELEKHNVANSTVNLSSSDGGGTVQLLELAEVRVGVFGLSENLDLSIPSNSLKRTVEAVRELKKRGAHVLVGLINLPRAAAQRLAARAPEVDLWILGLGHRPVQGTAVYPEEEKTVHPVKIGPGYLIEAGDRGRHVGQVILHHATEEGRFADPVGHQTRQASLAKTRCEYLRAVRQFGKLTEEERIACKKPLEMSNPARSGKRIEYTLVPVEKRFSEDEDVRHALDIYQAQLRARHNHRIDTAVPAAEGRGYAGQNACANHHGESKVHENALKFWSETRHAHAWQTLVEDKSQFDKDCIGCHVAGWRQPGGSGFGLRLPHHTARNESTLQDVQCEACHGPGQSHVVDPYSPDTIAREVDEQTCVACHNKKHSPRFDYGSYLKKIIGCKVIDGTEYCHGGTH